jgi:hypothetical protein
VLQFGNQIEGSGRYRPPVKVLRGDA